MKYEIDQSGRIEETNKVTIISIANNLFSYTVKIQAKVKRVVELKFKKANKPKLFAIYGFAAGLIILITKSKVSNSNVFIDVEYDGYQTIIEDILRRFIPKKQNITFSHKNIGKSSPAHYVAYKTYKSKQKANYTVGLREWGDLSQRLKP